MKVQLLHNAVQRASRRKTFLTARSHNIENLKLMLRAGYITGEEYEQLRRDHVREHGDDSGD
jgi:hypothetical protein